MRRARVSYRWASYKPLAFARECRQVTSRHCRDLPAPLTLRMKRVIKNKLAHQNLAVAQGECAEAVSKRGPLSLFHGLSISWYCALSLWLVDAQFGVLTAAL